MSKPTESDRIKAGICALALRRAITDPSTMGEKQTMHVDLSRPRRGQWLTTWANVRGFMRVDCSVAGTFYQHECLPGWVYGRDEIKTEMLPDLEVLERHGMLPKAATR